MSKEDTLKGYINARVWIHKGLHDFCRMIMVQSPLEFRGEDHKKSMIAALLAIAETVRTHKRFPVNSKESFKNITDWYIDAVSRFVISTFNKERTPDEWAESMLDNAVLAITDTIDDIKSGELDKPVKIIREKLSVH